MRAVHTPTTWQVIHLQPTGRQHPPGECSLPKPCPDFDFFAEKASPIRPAVSPARSRPMSDPQQCIAPLTLILYSLTDRFGLKVSTPKGYMEGERRARTGLGHRIVSVWSDSSPARMGTLSRPSYNPNGLPPPTPPHPPP